MKLKVTLLLVIIMLLMNYVALALLVRQEVDLNYVGNIEVEEVQYNNGKLWVRYVVEDGQWNENSARVYYRTKAVLLEGNINIAVITTLSFEGYKSLFDFQVLGVREGVYKLNYVNPNGDIVFLQSIELTKSN